MPFVRGWLAIAYTCGRPVAAVGLAPTAVTVAGLVLAWAVVPVAGLGGRWPLLAAVVVLVSALFDSLDGVVAVLSDRVSRWGALVDAVADRLADTAYAVALGALGAPWWLAAAWVGVGWLLEYARARAAALDRSGLDVVTVGERPTRIVVTIFALLGCAVLPGSASVVATVGAAAGAGVGLVGLVQLLVVLRRRLSAPSPG